MIHFLRARYAAELSYTGSRETARKAIGEDTGEEGYFENYYENGDTFRIFLKRKFPFSFLIAVPEGQGIWKDGTVQIEFHVSKMSHAVEWILYGPAAVMCVILAAAGIAAGLPILWKLAAFAALLLVLRQGLRTAGFWAEVFPALQGLENIPESPDFRVDKSVQ